MRKPRFNFRWNILESKTNVQPFHSDLLSFRLGIFFRGEKKERQESCNIIFKDKMLFSTCIKCQVERKSTVSSWTDYAIANRVCQMKNNTSVTRRFISTEIFCEEKSYRKDNFSLVISRAFRTCPRNVGEWENSKTSYICLFNVSFRRSF